MLLVTCPVSHGAAPAGDMAALYTCKERIAYGRDIGIIKGLPMPMFDRLKRSQILLAMLVRRSDRPLFAILWLHFALMERQPRIGLATLEGLAQGRRESDLMD